MTAGPLADQRRAIAAQRSVCAYCDRPLQFSAASFREDPDRTRALCGDCSDLRGAQSHQDYLLALRDFGFLTCGE